MNHSKPHHRKPNLTPIWIRASAIAGFLLLLATGLFLTTNPFPVEGKKLSLQDKGEVVQGVRVEMGPSAVVNFEELARQQALNPQTSDAVPLAISPPKTIQEVEVEGSKAPASRGVVPTDVPQPLIPSPAPATNFAGLNDIPFAPPGTAFFTIPPDTMGAVSPDSVNRVFNTLNNNYRIQDKSGVQIGGDVSMTNFWAPTGSTSPFDPRVQYDPYNNRWLLAGVSNAGTADTSILVGISAGSDPSGPFTLFRIPARVAVDPANINFADFPMLGFNKNWVVISINMFQTGPTAFVDGRSLVLDYPMLRAGTLSGTYFFGVSAANAGFCMHPATTYSGTENTEYLVAHLSSAGAAYRLHTITGTPGAPVFNVSLVNKVRPGGGWTQPGGNSVPQAGTCATAIHNIESSDSFIRSNVVFRNNSIWYPQTVGLPAGRTALTVDRTAAQWTQVDANGDFIQGGRVDDPTATPTNGGKWYNYPSISVNSNNDVLFGFSQFASNQFASAGYTYKDHTDAAGTMRDPLIFKAGEDCYSKDFGSGRNRWGDYSHTMVDPTDDCTLWTIQEYAKLQAPPTVGGSLSKWGTWWAEVNALGPCSALAPANALLINESCIPRNGQIDPAERVTVNLQITNAGAGPTVNLVGTLQSGGGVLYPSEPQNYGAIAPGTTVGRDFSFTADPALLPGQTITVTLALQDGATNHGTVSFTFIAGSNPGCGTVRLVSTSTLVRTSESNVQATIQISNIGTLPANNAMLTTAKLGTTDGTPLPQALGNILPGGSATATVNFNNSTPGVSSTLTVGGTFTGGSFSSTKRVVIP